jgi:Outer membrane protein beta-barrel domain
MKKALSICVLLLLVSSLSFSQLVPAKGKMTLGPALELSLPIGNFSDYAGFGFGGTARFEYGLEPNLALTGNLGYLYWGGKSGDQYDWSNSAVPLLAGVKYGIGKSFFVSGELGFYFYTIDWNYTGPSGGLLGFLGSYSASSTQFMLAPGIGYQKGPIEGLLRFYLLDTDLMNFSLMVAYNFPLN